MSYYRDFSYFCPGYFQQVPSHKPLTRKDISDLWYTTARLQEAAGKKDEAKESRRAARYFRGK